MDLKPLPFSSKLEAYQKQAEGLLAAHRAGHPQALKIFHEKSSALSGCQNFVAAEESADSEIRKTALDLGDAQLTIARWYNFQDWAALAQFVAEVTRQVRRWSHSKRLSEAVINGDLATLKSLLRENPELVRARSTRITHFDPPVHRSTLLHYVAANAWRVTARRLEQRGSKLRKPCCKPALKSIRWQICMAASAPP